MRINRIRFYLDIPITHPEWDLEKIEKEIKDKNNTKLIVESVKNIIINGEQ